ncbi:MAG: GNAT family N-acetyltransferase [Pseudomonadota bacterium]
MLTSWPALSVAFDGDWVIRLADGVTKRSNSVTCLAADDAELNRRIDGVEAIYREHGQPAIFRLSPLASPALDDRLDRRRWRRFDETIVMACDDADLGDRTDQPDADEVVIVTRPNRTWLEGCYRIDGSDSTHLATLETMLDRLVPKAGYASIGNGETFDALALIVVDAELAGLFEVLTVEEKRQQGLAQKLLGQLFTWSRQQGATTAWLAVVAENLPAVRLYEKLGFREVYRYHYRSNG